VKIRAIRDMAPNIQNVDEGPIDPSKGGNGWDTT